MIDFQGSQFEREIILWALRWYVAYPISYRQLEERMGERGVQGIIPPLLGGSSSMPRRLRNSSVADNARWAEAGDSMRPR